MPSHPKTNTVEIKVLLPF